MIAGGPVGEFLTLLSRGNTALVSRFEVLATLGEGSGGVVYRALDRDTGETVAIKTLTAGHGERIQHEARAIAALNHPHICVLHDVGRVVGADQQHGVREQACVAFAHDLLEQRFPAASHGPSSVLTTESVRTPPEVVPTTTRIAPDAGGSPG